MKSLFETKLAERTQSIYDFQRTFEEVCREIVQAAEAEEITGVNIDIQAKTTEAANEYMTRLIPLAVDQMQKWLDNEDAGLDMCNGSFYLRAFAENPLQTFLSADDSLVTKGLLDEHSAKVVTAVGEYATMSKSLIPKLNLWSERLEEKLEFRNSDSTKSGRTLSKATLAKLAEVESEFQQALNSGAITLATLRKLREAATPKKSISDAEYTQALFEIAVAKHNQEMAGLPTAA